MSQCRSFGRQRRDALHFSLGAPDAACSGKATGPLVSAEALGDAIDREVKEGLAYMFWGRLVALGTLALGAVLAVPLDRSGLYVAAIVAFGLLNALSFGLARSSRFATVATWSFVVIDAAILTYIFVTPSPFAVEGWTSQLNLRLPNFLYLGVFLVSMALSYSPALVVWSGAVTIVVWTIAYCWVATRPDSIAYGRDLLDGGLSDAEIIALVLDPRSVSLINLSYQTMFLVLVTIILAIAVWRSRRLVRKQVAAEAQRSALSRYFSPNIVRELSSGTSGFGEPSLQTAAILFADMVGFTRISEGLAPGDLVKLLKEYHARLATVAFAHGGTVDKYIGDEIMVHFGTPRPRMDDAARALACAREMLEQVRQWNEQRLASGEYRNRGRYRRPLRRGHRRKHRRRASPRIHGAGRHGECCEQARTADAQNRDIPCGQRGPADRGTGAKRTNLAAHNRGTAARSDALRARASATDRRLVPSAGAQAGRARRSQPPPALGPGTVEASGSISFL